VKCVKKLILFVISFFLLNQVSIACSCAEYYTPECVKIVRSDSVFIGKIERLFKVSKKQGKPIRLNEKEAIEHSDQKSSGQFMARFSIIQQYKGEATETVDAFSQIGSSCTSDFNNLKIGEVWIIYANFNVGSKQWQFDLGMCSYSRKQNNNQFLENFRLGRTAETVEGRIVESSFRRDGVENVVVAIEGNGFSESKSTSAHLKPWDENGGSFKFHVPSIGKYRVSLSLPIGSVLVDSLEDLPISKTIGATDIKFSYEVNVAKGLCGFNQLETFLRNPSK
jgi:hypothetical protein